MVSVGVGILGIVMAYMVYVRGVLDVDRVYGSMRVLHNTFRNQFFTEALYHKVIARGYLNLSKATFLVGDRGVIDGTINLSYKLFFRATRTIWKLLDIKSIDIFIHWLALGMFRSGRNLRLIQSGLLNNYVSFLLVGLVFVLGVMLYALEKLRG
jgi:NADH-quinone oxidoreductase subunit L